MRENLRFPLLLLFSLLLHIGILSLIPTINFDRINEEKVYEVKLIKPKPKKIKAVHKQKIEKKSSAQKEQQKPKLKEIEKKKIDYAGLKKPDIVLPKVTNQNEKIDVSKSLVETEQNKGISENIAPSANVKKELSKASKSFKNIKKDSNKKGIKGAIYSDNDFFELKSLSDNERYLLNKPKPPKYSLENDTKIILKFYIDKYGKPIKITYLSRSESKIEKLALDYVNKLRFAAVDYDTLDPVQITLYFKVR